MARLIDAEHLAWNVKGIKCGKLTVKHLLWILENQEPTVDAEPVRHGRIEADGYTYTCSVCESRLFEHDLFWRYCPYCGARLDDTEDTGKNL